MITIKELAVVGIPETILATLLGFTLKYGSNAYKTQKNVILKLILSNIFILTVIYICRSNISNITITSTISIITYIIAFKSIWKFNNRESVLIGQLTTLFLAVTEIVAYPTFNLLANGEAYLENKIILSIIPSLVRILFIIIIIKKNINITQLQITNKDYNKLTVREKLTILLFIVLIGSCLIFNFNYIDLFFKLNEYSINQMNINVNLYHIENVLLLITTIVLVLRTIDFEVYRYYVSKEPEELLEDIISISSDKELEKYKQKIEQKLKKGGMKNEKSST